MLKDLSGSLLQLLDPQKKILNAKFRLQQSSFFNNPFKDDHLQGPQDQIIDNYPSNYKGAPKEILSVQIPRLKSYSMDRPGQQIVIDRPIQTEMKIQRGKNHAQGQNIGVCQLRGQHQKRTIQKLQYSTSIFEEQNSIVGKRKELSPFRHPSIMQITKNQQIQILGISNNNQDQQLLNHFDNQLNNDIDKQLYNHNSHINPIDQYLISPPENHTNQNRFSQTENHFNYEQIDKNNNDNCNNQKKLNVKKINKQLDCNIILQQDNNIGDQTDINSKIENGDNLVQNRIFQNDFDKTQQLIQNCSSDNKQINIFENIVLKNILHEIKQDSEETQDCSPIRFKKTINMKQSDASPIRQNEVSQRKQKQKESNIQDQSSFNSFNMQEHKSISQKQLSRQFHHFQPKERNNFLKRASHKSYQIETDIGDQQIQNLQDSVSNEKQRANQQPIDYIHYATSEMKKRDMERNIKEAIFTHVAIEQSKQNIRSKEDNKRNDHFQCKDIIKSNDNIIINQYNSNNDSNHKNENIENGENIQTNIMNQIIQQHQQIIEFKTKHIQRDYESDLSQREEDFLGESQISNASYKFLPPKGSHETSSKNQLRYQDQLINKNSKELSLASKRNNDKQMKKYLPKLKVQQNCRFVKISQKSFGDDSIEHQTSVNLIRTPSLTILRDSPQRKRLPSIIEKENTQLCISSQQITLNKNTKNNINKLKYICSKKNFFGKVPHEETSLQTLEGGRENHMSSQTSCSKMYSYQSQKKLNDIHKNLLDLTQTLQKQEKKQQNNINN